MTVSIGLGRARALSTAYGVSLVRVVGVRRYVQQVRAMFVKLVLHAARNVAMSVTQLLTPVVFVALACAIIRYSTVSVESYDC